LFRRCSHFPALDPLQKRPRQLALAGMALSVNRAQVKELVAERVPLSLPGKNVLQRNRQLAQPRSLGPAAFFTVLAYVFRE
jgi:hypothetical protein